MPSGKQHWQLPHNAMCKVCPPPGTIHPLESPWNESKYIWHHLAKANANVKLERSLIDMEWIGANRAKQMMHNTAEIQPFYRTSQFEPGSVSKCITHHNRVVSRNQHWICWKITGLRVYIPPKVAVKWNLIAEFAASDPYGDLALASATAASVSSSSWVLDIVRRPCFTSISSMLCLLQMKNKLDKLGFKWIQHI